MPKEIRYSWEASLELGQDECIVIAKIYEYNFIRKESIWLTKLSELLKDDMSPSKLLKILNKLEDLGYITYQYGETVKGHAGRLIVIDTFESPYKDWAEKIYKEVESG